MKQRRGSFRFSGERKGLNESVGIRIFRAGTVEYEVPYLVNTSVELTEPGLKPARYVTGQQQYFDSSYRLSKKPTDDIIAALTAALPNPNDYSNYFEYEQALLNWKSDVDDVLNALKLPLPLGRYAFRPPPSRRAKIGNISDDYSSNLSSSLTTDEETSDSINSPRDLSSDDARRASLDSGAEIDLLFDDPSKYDRSELPADPWETVLVPAEPDPRDFDSYQDYEDALKRWACVCSKLPFIPPHAYQLAELIPINVPKQSNRRLEETNLMDEIEEPRKVGLVRVDFWPDDITPLFVLSQIMAESKMTTTTHSTHKRQLQQSSAPNIRAAEIVSGMLDTIEQRASSRMNKYGRSSEYCLPRVHGTLPSPNKAKPEFINNALRRVDLTSEQIQSTYDCSTELDGVSIDFSLPYYDIRDFSYSNLAYYLPLKSTKLLGDNEPIRHLQNTALRLQFHHRRDHLCSWYWPNKCTNKAKQRAERLLEKTNSLSDLCTVLTKPRVMLDSFEDFLTKQTRESKENVFQLMKQKDIAKVLELLSLNKNALTHAKVSAYITGALQTASGVSYVDYLINKEDVTSLSLMAYAVVYFNDVPLDLFPYNQELLDVTLHIIGSRFSNILKHIFMRYYLVVIQDFISKSPEQYEALAAYITKTRQSIGSKIHQSLVAEPSFLSELLFKHIGHRSSSVSAALLFVSIQLLHDTSNTAIRECLVANLPTIFNQLKELAQSKISHARFACRRLHAILLSSEWLSSTLAIFNKTNTTAFAKEFVNSSHSRNSDYFPMLNDFALKALERVRMEQSPTALSEASFVLNDSAFKLLIDHCVNSISAVDRRISYIAQTISAICKTLWIIGKISVASDSTRVSNDFIVINSSVIKNFILFIKNAKGPEQRFVDEAVMCTLELLINTSSSKPNTDIMKKVMLAGLRHLIKSDGVFALVREDEEFHATISSYCKKQQHHGCNLEAWRTFHQMIAYHPGTVERLIKSKFLGPYMELIGTANGMIVMQHSLRYLFKTLNLDVDNPLQSKNKFEADIKLLIDWITNQHLFIKIHMIYKKLSEDAAGAAFSDLVKLYIILQTSPLCSKLLKEASKTPDFKEGIRKVMELIAEDEDMLKWKKALAKDKERREKEEKERREKEEKERKEREKKEKKKAKEKEKDRLTREKEKEKKKDKK